VDPATAQQWRLLSARLHGRPAKARPWTFGRISLRPAMAIAALAGVVVLAIVLQRDPETQRTTFETLRGQQTTLNLVDGSEVQINHTSALSVAAGDGARHVSLEGEAYFRVKTGSPFVVETSVGTVTVLGTEFNVRVREGELEVAVIRGKVSVAAGAGEERTVLLSAGEQTRCGKDGMPTLPERVRHPDYPGWIHGRLLFDRTPLTAVCRELEDHFDISITSVGLADDMTITGALDAGNAERAVSALAVLIGAGYSHDTNGYTLR
jgi:ferric-dicitrate binding protein FerR (iron transport regulator)